jgi:hypothetical protein
VNIVIQQKYRSLKVLPQLLAELCQRAGRIWIIALILTSRTGAVAYREA